MKKTVVPFRNGIFLSMGTGFAESLGADAVAIAAHAGDHTIYPDCREDFLNPMAQAMESGTYAHIKLLRPFVSMDKTAIVRRGAELKVDYARTWVVLQGWPAPLRHLRNLHRTQGGLPAGRRSRSHPVRHHPTPTAQTHSSCLIPCG